MIDLNGEGPSFSQSVQDRSAVALLSTTFFLRCWRPYKKRIYLKRSDQCQNPFNGYVRGVELTGKTETFELEFPYSYSFAYVRLFRRMLRFFLGTFSVH